MVHQLAWEAAWDSDSFSRALDELDLDTAWALPSDCAKNLLVAQSAVGKPCSASLKPGGDAAGSKAAVGGESLRRFQRQLAQGSLSVPDCVMQSFGKSGACGRSSFGWMRSPKHFDAV